MFLPLHCLRRYGLYVSTNIFCSHIYIVVPLNMSLHFLLSFLKELQRKGKVIFIKPYISLSQHFWIALLPRCWQQDPLTRNLRLFSITLRGFMIQNIHRTRLSQCRYCACRPDLTVIRFIALSAYFLSYLAHQTACSVNCFMCCSIS